MTCTTFESERPEDFQALEGEWNDLLAESTCPVPFLRHEWLSTWWTHFGPGHRLVLILARRSGRLVLAAPLMEVDRRFLGRPLRVLQSITNPHSFRYGVLFRKGDGAAVDAFWAYLRDRPRPWDMLQLARVPRGNGVNELATPAARQRIAVDTVPSLTSPLVRIEGDWEAYESTLKTRFRQNLRNRAKRLRALGTVTFETLADPAPALAALDHGFALEASGWKRENGTAILLDPNLESFYRKVAEIAAAKGWLRLFFLKVNDRPAAFAMRLLYENKVYCIKVGNDPEFSPYSVGQLLSREMLRWAHEQGVTEYEFMGERSRQKLDWARDVREHVTLYAHNTRLRSRLHRFQRLTARRLLKRALPAPVLARVRPTRRDEK